MDNNALDRDWRAGSLLRFALPTTVMLLLMGLYTLTDTIFVARFVNTDALSAINIVCPVLNAAVGLGTMLAAGGSAVISRAMGEGEYRRAKEVFTLLLITGAAAGLLLLVAGTVWMEPMIYALGASGLLFPYCRDYLTVLLLFMPANILQTMFSNLFVTAGRPGLGFGLSMLAGGANVALDYVFMVYWDLGVCGAALGTGIGCLIPAAAGVVFFARSPGPLALTRPVWRWAAIRDSCFNGSSEMVSQLAAALTTVLFNLTMMQLLGEDGVAAVTIIIYAQFLLNTLYIGFSMGVAPVIGFYCGKGDGARRRRVESISIGFIAAASGLTAALSRLGAPRLVGLFAPEGSAVYQIAVDGFARFSVSFLFSGLNIFTSALYTARSNGRVSALLSFLRTFVLLSGGLLLLPRIWGVAGVWLAVPAAEGIMFAVSAVCLFKVERAPRFPPPGGGEKHGM